MKTTQDDIQLLCGLYEGKEASFRAIYDKYFESLFLYAMKVLNDRIVCEDIVQDIFVSLWTKRREAKITSLKPYLFQAVKYQIFNYFRNNKFSREDLTRLNIVDVSMNVIQKLEYSELDQMIRDTVVKLPKRCRHIFVLSRYHHKSNKEIAEELEISVQAVKNQISKALAFLRNNLHHEEAITALLLLLF
ncbi:RNA polymerase sigma-70 factor [Pseudozobellia thermophila]|uniref:RNA polymerase sigma-70 factor, ECF subfamily n=1 Tax=Pseudozobellia thermophila TaxID=192903 RepID=A0A1M6LFP6_9FLAO|nr:RNA polymerase sigma-70 factor [Pseudozobellia thermophila]SHJ70002.1 RNA polymerase sigma-70 factor, ECF subfamily [Pseudozobellia thermophila]